MIERSSLRNRRGYSLIELLLVVAISSLLMSAVAVVLHAMYGANRQLRENVAFAQAMPRLALQLRTDAHAASDVTMLDAAIGSPGITLAFAANDEVVEYQSGAGRVIRTRRHDQAMLGREVYWLDKNATVDWQIVDAPSPLVEFTVVRTMGKIESPDARRTDRVIAAIGVRVPRPVEGVADVLSE